MTDHGRDPSGQALVNGAASVSALSGFDPSRWSKEWGDEFLSVTRKEVPEGFKRWWAKWGDTVRFWRVKSLARTAYQDGFEIGARAAFIALSEVQAIAMEARQRQDAEERLDPKGDSAAPTGIAPTQSGPSS